MPTEAADTARRIDAVRRAITAEPRVDLARHPIDLAFEADALVLEGEVANIAAKKLALERAAAVRGVHHIIDRLRVTPSARQTDGEIRDLVRDALLQEPAFADTGLRLWIKGKLEMARAPDRARGTIDVRVEDGVVTLDGEVPGLARKRLAGVLAWWVPGSRDVVNGLGVTPPEEDSDDEIADAVRLVLEKDPFVDATQIRVGVRRSIVTLAGLVPSEPEREMAEFDAWYVFGVDGVVNRIEVRRGPGTATR
jgi:osmotically-inducible protein OsmY